MIYLESSSWVIHHTTMDYFANPRCTTHDWLISMLRNIKFKLQKISCSARLNTEKKVGTFFPCATIHRIERLAAKTYSWDSTSFTITTAASCAINWSSCAITIEPISVQYLYIHICFFLYYYGLMVFRKIQCTRCYE